MIQLPHPLENHLIDEFSKIVFKGAVSVANDAANPLRGNLFASAMRELITHTIHTLAPDKAVATCCWFRPETGNGSPSRRQRFQYMIHGGISKDYAQNELHLEVDELCGELLEVYESLNRATHLREGTIVREEEDVALLVNQIFSALSSLYNTIAECKRTALKAVNDSVIDETINEALSETIQSIDEIATHHSIEEVYIERVSTTRIDADYIWFQATGTIEAGLQWGSNSDVRRGDGAELDHSFPFECDIPAPVDSPKELDTSLIELRVSDGGWYDNYYDDEELG